MRRFIFTVFTLNLLILLLLNPVSGHTESEDGCFFITDNKEVLCFTGTVQVSQSTTERECRRACLAADSCLSLVWYASGECRLFPVEAASSRRVAMTARQARALLSVGNNTVLTQPISKMTGGRKKILSESTRFEYRDANGFIHSRPTGVVEKTPSARSAEVIRAVPRVTIVGRKDLIDLNFRRRSASGSRRSKRHTLVGSSPVVPVYYVPVQPVYYYPTVYVPPVYSTDTVPHTHVIGKRDLKPNVRVKRHELHIVSSPAARPVTAPPTVTRSFLQDAPRIDNSPNHISQVVSGVNNAPIGLQLNRWDNTGRDGRIRPVYVSYGCGKRNGDCKNRPWYEQWRAVQSGRKKRQIILRDAPSTTAPKVPLSPEQRRIRQQRQRQRLAKGSANDLVKGKGKRRGVKGSAKGSKSGKETRSFKGARRTTVPRQTTTASTQQLKRKTTPSPIQSKSASAKPKGKSKRKGKAKGTQRPPVNQQHLKKQFNLTESAKFVRRQLDDPVQRTVKQAFTELDENVLQERQTDYEYQYPEYETTNENTNLVDGEDTAEPTEPAGEEPAEPEDGEEPAEEAETEDVPEEGEAETEPSGFEGPNDWQSSQANTGSAGGGYGATPAPTYPAPQPQPTYNQAAPTTYNRGPDTGGQSLYQVQQDPIVPVLIVRRGFGTTASFSTYNSGATSNTAYGSSVPSYPAPAPQYQATPSYPAPAPQYPAPTPSYTAPAPTYPAPQPQYQAPQPQPQYQAPAASTPYQRRQRLRQRNTRRREQARRRKQNVKRFKRRVDQDDDDISRSKRASSRYTIVDAGAPRISRNYGTPTATHTHYQPAPQPAFYQPQPHYIYVQPAQPVIYLIVGAGGSTTGGSGGTTTGGFNTQSCGTDSAHLHAQPGAKYMEKRASCVNNGGGETGSGTCDNILLSENTMLVGFAESVTTAATQQECIDNCLNSLRELGFECQSGMFFDDGNTDNCILNVATATTNPDLLTSTNEDVTYFEPDC